MAISAAAAAATAAATSSSLDDGSADLLKLSAHKGCRKMLSKLGESDETVLFSVKVGKINKRSKEQLRAMLLTDRAIYNLKCKDFSKCLRRMQLDKVVAISVSETTDEFVVHIPDEYDYRYKSSQKETIVEHICRAYSSRMDGKRTLPVRRVDSSAALITSLITKDQSRTLSREDRKLRIQELLQTTQDLKDEIKESEKITLELCERVDVSFDDGSDSAAAAAPCSFEYLKIIGRGAISKCIQVRIKEDHFADADADADSTHRRRRRVLAMKVIDRSGGVDEARLLLSFKHPFLMQLKYAFKTERKLYVVLDYHQSGQLYLHLKWKRRFTENQSRLLIAEIGSAIGYLHSLGIIYRELKPENVLCDADGHVCLSDFGLSKDLTRGGAYAMESYTFTGTAEYLAPEMVDGSGQRSKSVDWWALGILLYELVCGVTPFSNSDQIRFADPVIPPFLTQECSLLICSLLERSPKSRLGSKGEFKNEIIQMRYFSDYFTMDDLMNKRIRPAFIPPETGAIRDACLFI